jgi:cobalt-zinc-cadmium efflux system outer membrane protein
MRRTVTLLAVLLAASGCAVRTETPDVADLAARIERRTGAMPRGGTTSPDPLPPGVAIDDGVTLTEAVAIALWNNAEFQASVIELGFARADLVDAGLLRNPVLSLLFPVGPKQLEATLKWPIEALWERPRRIAAAGLAVDRVAASLEARGLDLAAATKVAYAELAFAIDRLRLTEDASVQRERVAGLTDARLRAGDISELEARTARIEAARAQQDAARARLDVAVRSSELRQLLGLALDARPIRLADAAPPAASCGTIEAMREEAFASRPDVRAAEIAVEEAGRRLGWERGRIMALTAMLDANGQGAEGFEMGPGIEIGAPIFDRNQGGRARAAAAMERASHSYAAIRERVATELQTAVAQLEYARQAQALWRDSVVLPSEQQVQAAERAYVEGDVSLLFVLDTTRRLTDARLRAREAQADVDRGMARLERAIGRRCGPEGKEIRGDQ